MRSEDWNLLFIAFLWFLFFDLTFIIDHKLAYFYPKKEWNISFSQEKAKDSNGIKDKVKWIIINTEIKLKVMRRYFSSTLKFLIYVAFVTFIFPPEVYNLS